jgi:hypothetical protein
MEYLKYFYQQLKEKICGCFTRDRSGLRRSRTISTFIRFEDLDDAELKTKYEEAVLEVRKATEPNDILWKNMKGDRGHFICRRMLIYLACLILIMFVSTPIFIFANMKKADSQHFFDLGWADYIYGGAFLKSNFPALCVIMINIALLYLIDIVAYLEFQETHSLYQRSVFTKTLIYLTLNMLLIPALTLSNSLIDSEKKMTVTTTQVAEANSLYAFLKMKNFDITQVIGSLYVGDNGIFFVTLVLMQAAVSCSYYLLQWNDVFYAYFSPWLAIMKRQVY